MPENIPLPLGNQQTEAEQFFNQAWQQYQAKDYQSAINTYQKALKIYRQLNDQISIARVLNTIGVSHYQLSQLIEAKACYDQALAIFREHPVSDRESMVLNNIGLFHKQQGEYSEALDYYHQALPIAATNQKGNILDNIGYILFQQGKLFEALDYYHQTLVDRHTMNDANEITTINNIIETASALSKSKNPSSVSPNIASIKGNVIINTEGENPSITEPDKPDEPPINPVELDKKP